MAICQKCGQPLGEGARFCFNCGAPAEAASAELCPKCGAALRPGGKFCPKCRTPVGVSAPAGPSTGGNMTERFQRAKAAGQQPASQVREQPAPREETRSVLTQAAGAIGELAGSIQAPDTTGAMTIDLPALSGAMAGGLTGGLADDTILGPFMTVTRSLGGFFKGLGDIFKDKRALITALVTSAVWIALWLWNRSSHANRVSDILSGLTFAEGGTRGTFGQILGGTAGKLLVLTGLSSLADGGGKDILAGARRLFGKGLDVGLCIAGFGIAGFFYQIFAGYAGTYGLMVALSGAAVSLQALGGRGGFVRSIIVSLTAKKTGGARALNDGAFRSLLTGMTVGFTLSACLSGRYVPWWLWLIAAAAGAAVKLIIPIIGKRAVKA